MPFIGSLLYFLPLICYGFKFHLGLFEDYTQISFAFVIPDFIACNGLRCSCVRTLEKYPGAYTLVEYPYLCQPFHEHMQTGTLPILLDMRVVLLCLCKKYKAWHHSG